MVFSLLLLLPIVALVGAVAIGLIVFTVWHARNVLGFVLVGGLVIFGMVALAGFGWVRVQSQQQYAFAVAQEHEAMARAMESRVHLGPYVAPAAPVPPVAPVGWPNVSQPVFVPPTTPPGAVEVVAMQPVGNADQAVEAIPAVVAPSSAAVEQPVFEANQNVVVATASAAAPEPQAAEVAESHEVVAVQASEGDAVEAGTVEGAGEATAEATEAAAEVGVAEGAEETNEAEATTETASAEVTTEAQAVATEETPAPSTTEAPAASAEVPADVPSEELAPLQTQAVAPTDTTTPAPGTSIETTENHAEPNGSSSSTEAPAVAASSTAATLSAPAWVENPPREMDGHRVDVLISEPFEVRSDCERDLERKVAESVYRYACDVAAGHQRFLPRSSSLNPQIAELARREQYTKVHASSVGDMQVVYQLLVFDENVQQRVDEWVRTQGVQETLKATTGLSAMALGVLASVFGIFRIAARRSPDPLSI